MVTMYQVCVSQRKQTWRWSHHDQWNTPIADIWMVVLPYQIRMQQSEIAAADVTKASRSYARPKAATAPTRQVVFVRCRSMLIASAAYRKEKVMAEERSLCSWANCGYKGLR